MPAMSVPQKIVFLGGGSTQFAPALLVDFIHTPELNGSTIVLVDLDEQKLDSVYRLGQRLLAAGEGEYTLERTTDRVAALPGADVVLVSVEINRLPCWEQDRAIPAAHGISQALGENGGPGGLFHALRQIPPIVEIAQDMARLCPGAPLLNLANPMSRILQAVHDTVPEVPFIGLCHEIKGGNEYLAWLLEIDEARLAVTAAGLNHFAWYLDIRDAETGADLYPRVRELAREKPFAERLLAADVLRQTGVLSITSDSHVGEYLAGGHLWTSAWAPGTEPVDFFAAYMAYLADAEDKMAALIAGKAEPDDFLAEPSGEIVTQLIADLALGRERRYDAFNLPNDGLVPDLPEACIVEVPARVGQGAVRGEPVRGLPPLIAAWCRTQTAIHARNAKAALEGDRQAALEALLLDPVVPDRVSAEACLDAMLEANRDYLPRFFG